MVSTTLGGVVDKKCGGPGHPISFHGSLAVYPKRHRLPGPQNHSNICQVRSKIIPRFLVHLATFAKGIRSISKVLAEFVLASTFDIQPNHSETFGQLPVEQQVVAGASLRHVGSSPCRRI